jgi:hypothetical protein
VCCPLPPQAIEHFSLSFRDGNKWFPRTILEEKDVTWKRDITRMVLEVKRLK